MSLKTRVALFLYGRRARRLLEEARRDLAAMPLPDAVARRRAIGVSPVRRRTALRLVHRAVAAVLAKEGETHPCLARALALYGDARRHGFAPSLVLGVRKDGGEVASHAWLELRGRPFLEPHETPERYETVAVLPKGA